MTPLWGRPRTATLTSLPASAYGVLIIASAQDSTQNALSLYQILPANCSILPIRYHTAYNNPQALAIDTCQSNGTLAIQVVAESGVNESIASLRLKLEVDQNGDGTYSHTVYATTDENGRYTFTHLPTGSYRLSIVNTRDTMDVLLTANNLQQEVQMAFTGSLPRLFLPLVVR